MAGGMSSERQSTGRPLHGNHEGGAIQQEMLAAIQQMSAKMSTQVFRAKWFTR